MNKLLRLEERLQKLEAYQQNHTNQMIETLVTLNENIISLGESLKAASIVGMEEKVGDEQVKLEADKDKAKNQDGQQNDRVCSKRP